MRHRAASPSAEAIRSTPLSILLNEYSCQGILRTAAACATLTTVISDDERIALFLDYENLAIGARDGLGVSARSTSARSPTRWPNAAGCVARRAYADWSAFDEDRRLLARAQVELIEIPQRLGGSRKNAADIKMAVDAIELAYERSFITTFAIGTGDSDFTPLVHKLREMDKRVIGIGVQSSTSALLPPACDEFLFYDRLPGVEQSHRREIAPVAAPDRGGGPGRRARWSPRRSPASPGTPTVPCSPRASSARCCARTRRSTRPTTVSAASASCCATWRAAGRDAAAGQRAGRSRGRLPRGDAADDDAFALLVDVVAAAGPTAAVAA